MIINLLIDISNHHKEDDLIRNILEPIVWIRKYFNIASDSWNLFDEIISGINDNMLISRAVHIRNILLLDITIIVLTIVIEYSNILIGAMWVDIKI
jgi:hypothetical protein